MSRGEAPRAASAPLAEHLERDRQTALRLVPVSRETEKRFAIFIDLLGRWRKTTNLISESSFASAWTRHIADCAQLIALAPDARRWLDIGSGAGFPGLVIAIQLTDAQGAVVHCVESDKRKCAFLREVVRVTGAPAQIHPARLENIDPSCFAPVDAVTARAFAPLPKTLELARVWLEQGAIGVFPRGRSAEDQVEALTLGRGSAVEVLPSAVDAEAGILRIGRANRRRLKSTP
jgi:16S rRNA (guanine527-N7)-methyltransferase